MWRPRSQLGWFFFLIAASLVVFTLSVYTIKYSFKWLANAVIQNAASASQDLKQK